MNNAKIAELLRELASLFDAEPEAAKETIPVKLEDIRAVLTRLSRKGLTEKVHELIVSFGAEKLSGIPQEKYADLLAAAQELEHAE